MAGQEAHLNNLFIYLQINNYLQIFNMAFCKDYAVIKGLYCYSSTGHFFSQLLKNPTILELAFPMVEPIFFVLLAHYAVITKHTSLLNAVVTTCLT